MIKKEISGLGQDLYIEKLDNGLTLYFLPFNNRKNYYIEYVTNFGSIIDTFKTEEMKTFNTVPYGVAHFLEHKMFEQENGEDPFKFFSRYGSDANASTSYQSTSYFVEGTANIEENLDFLLTYVNSPYFTDENVEKEKNIIVEEINMYNDEPEGKLYRESNKAIFKVHPMRIDIGGTEESVRSITKEDLYSCYNTFYQPSNMALFIGGNFDIDKVLDVVRNNKALMGNTFNKKIIIKKKNEPVAVNCKFKEIEINNMIIPKFVFTIKLSLKEIPVLSRCEYITCVSLLLGILFGNSSLFKEEMLKRGLMTAFAASKGLIDDFLLIEFVAESKKPKELYEEVIKCFKNQKIENDEVERQKKVYISDEVSRSDKVISSVSSFIDDYLAYGDIVCNRMDIVKAINLDKINKVRSSIDINNSSIVIAYPKE